MDYVLYTPVATYPIHIGNGVYTLSDPAPEFVWYKDADLTVAIDEIFSPSDCCQIVSFWLGNS
jgi:hypothetical protein